MKKKTLIVFFVIYLLLFSLNVKATTKPVFYIKDAVKYSDTDKVTVELYMENVNKELSSWSLDFKYDNEKLEFLDSKAGKDLHASFKLAENVPEESRVAIGAVSFIGFKNDGIYYSVTFRVKDNSSDIPIELNVRDFSDEDGNQLEFEQKSGKIIIEKNKNLPKQEDKKEIKQEIKDFEQTKIEQLDTIENIIVENGNIDVSTDDSFIYENDNTDVIEILDDGTMIPNKDGKANVKVKLNDNTAGMLEVEVKDGKVTKISTIEVRDDFTPVDTTDETIDNKLQQNTISNTNDKDDGIKIKYIIVIMVITILFIIFLIIKKKRGGKK